MTISGNATGRFCGLAIGDYGAEDYQEVYLTVQLVTTYTLWLTIVYPENTTYTDPEVPVSLYTTGNDTGVTINYNVQFSNGSWLYISNQTYTAPTYMTINENATSATFYGYAAGDHQSTDNTVQFSVALAGYIWVNLSVEAAYGGTTDPAPGSYLYPAWSNVELTAIPDDYSTFISWEIDGENVSESTVYYLEVTTEDHVAKAYFESYPEPGRVSTGNLWLFLFEGDFIGWFYALLVSTFSFLSLGIALVVMLFLVPLYIRTGSLLLLCIAWLLIGSFLIVLVPEVSGLAVLFMVMGVGGLVYRLFRPSSSS